MIPTKLITATVWLLGPVTFWKFWIFLMKNKLFPLL